MNKRLNKVISGRIFQFAWLFYRKTGNSPILLKSYSCSTSHFLQFIGKKPLSVNIYLRAFTGFLSLM